MWRPQIGKLGEPIAVGSYLIPRYLSICESSQECIGGVVCKCSATVRKGRWARGVIGQDLRQHCPSQPLRFLRRVSPRGLQPMREGADETDTRRRVPRG